MAERRSLSAAISMTPEKEQFIKNDKNDVFGDLSSDAANASATSQNNSDSDRTVQRKATQRRADVRRDVEPANYVPQTLVSVTTRLQQETATALRRAYLEQKLSRRTPDTQQEIIEDALQQWLYERGFLG